MGKVDNYVRMLSRFLDSERNAIDQLRPMLQAGSSSEAIRLAHTLKGTSGMLGLITIQQNAAELETGLKESLPPDQLETLMTSLDHHLKTLHKQIQQLLQ